MICYSQDECAEDKHGLTQRTYVKQCKRLRYVWWGIGSVQNWQNCQCGQKGRSCLTFSQPLIHPQSIHSEYPWELLPHKGPINPLAQCIWSLQRHTERTLGIWKGLAPVLCRGQLFQSSFFSFELWLWNMSLTLGWRDVESLFLSILIDHVQRARQRCGGGGQGVGRELFKDIAVSLVTLQHFRDYRVTGLSPLSTQFLWVFWSVDFPMSVTQSNTSFLACSKRELLLKLLDSKGKSLHLHSITQDIIPR